MAKKNNTERFAWVIAGVAVVGVIIVTLWQLIQAATAATEAAETASQVAEAASNSTVLGNVADRLASGEGFFPSDGLFGTGFLSGIF